MTQVEINLKIFSPQTFWILFLSALSPFLPPTNDFGIFSLLWSNVFALTSSQQQFQPSGYNTRGKHQLLIVEAIQGEFIFDRFVCGSGKKSLTHRWLCNWAFDWSAAKRHGDEESSSRHPLNEYLTLLCLSMCISFYLKLESLKTSFHFPWCLYRIAMNVCECVRVWVFCCLA